MNWVRLATAAVAAWVASIVIGFIVNTYVMVGLYDANAATMRPEAEIMGGLPLGFAFMLVGFFAFAYAYAKGYEGGNGVVEGLRFGLIVGAMLVCFSVIWIYVTTPISSALANAFIADYLIEYTIYGGIVGAIYKKKAAA